jgi:hypothetical protein
VASTKSAAALEFETFDSGDMGPPKIVSGFVKHYGEFFRKRATSVDGFCYFPNRTRVFTA